MTRETFLSKSSIIYTSFCKVKQEKNGWPLWFNSSMHSLVCTKNCLFKHAQWTRSSKHWEISRTPRNQTVIFSTKVACLGIECLGIWKAFLKDNWIFLRKCQVVYGLCLSPPLTLIIITNIDWFCISHKARYLLLFVRWCMYLVCSSSHLNPYLKTTNLRAP